MTDYSASPGVHIFADTEAGLARMRRTAGTAGCRTVSAILIGAGPEPALTPGASLLIELEHEASGDAAIPVLDLAMAEAERGARGAVISAPLALIDLVAARAAHSDIEQLCEAGEEERAAAVARAARRREARLHDSRRERHFSVLQPRADTAGEVQATRADAAFIRAMIRSRRLRTHYFDADLFADPAWDMLLDLMAARLEGKKVAVSSLCIAAAVPATTALRWIGVLTDSGLVVRAADPEDRRRVHIELAEATWRALGAWLHEARSLSPLPA
ncbi:MAG TPA: hypothetical protein VEC11_10020 [Allosphingosinicella sp.]|nr:hypothetical protein [Allosphingosinicella sp.]